jgi:hypothetical protein
MWIRNINCYFVICNRKREMVVTNQSIQFRTQLSSQLNNGVVSVCKCKSIVSGYSVESRC